MWGAPSPASHGCTLTGKYKMCANLSTPYMSRSASTCTGGRRKPGVRQRPLRRSRPIPSRSRRHLVGRQPPALSRLGVGVDEEARRVRQCLPCSGYTLRVEPDALVKKGSQLVASQRAPREGGPFGLAERLRRSVGLPTVHPLEQSDQLVRRELKIRLIDRSCRTCGGRASRPRGGVLAFRGRAG